ncbi:MAG TPA: DegV family protein [Acidimicrobiales bacterium]|nr:DegV family protein [Acidimicrobiales bacterium]
MPVRIVTDSAADLPPNDVEQLGVAVVPLSIRFGDKEYTDGVDLSVEEFYAKLASTDALPETSAPAPGAFDSAFRRQAEAGADAVVCINLSSGLSATIQAAQSAAAGLAGELDVRVVDSRSITSGLGTHVRLAAAAAGDGASADEVVALVENLVPRTHVFGALDTLENLKKGGRIGGARAMLGSLLSIKPLLDISSGEVEEAGKARTRRKALEWLRDRIFEQSDIEHLTIAHGLAPDLDAMLDLLAPRYSRDQISITTIGATIGTHGGPRVMGATWVDPA